LTNICTRFWQAFKVALITIALMSLTACDFMEEGQIQGQYESQVVTEDEGNLIHEPPKTIEDNRNPEYAVDGFLLTIAVEENILPQGMKFQVQVELENLMDEEAEISYDFLFVPIIPNWSNRCCLHGCFEGSCNNVVAQFDLPESAIEVLYSKDTIRNICFRSRRELDFLSIGNLPQGKHDLVFRASFWFQDEYIEIISNEIILTVQ
jgi:hypothetical protein